MFLLGELVNAQERTPITHANYAKAEQFSQKKMERMLHSQTVSPNWFKDSDKFWYKWENSDGTKYFIVDPANKSKKEIFDMDWMAEQISIFTHDPFDWQHIPFKKFRLKDDKYFYFDIQSNLEIPKELTEKEKLAKDKLSKKDTTDTKSPAPKKRPEMVKKLFHFKYDLSTGTLTDATKEVKAEKKRNEFPRWANISPDSSYVLYAKGYDLYWMDMTNMRKAMKDEKDSTIIETRLTKDGVKDFSYGGDNYKGSGDIDSTKKTKVWCYWAPDSKHFAFLKYDMRMVKDLWVIHSIRAKRPELETYKYEMPGEPGNKTYMMIFDMATSKYKYINTYAYKDQSLDLFSKNRTHKDSYNKWFKMIWMGDNENLYLARKSRDLHKIDICRLNINEDTLHVLFEERLNTYQEIHSLRPINNSKQMLWWSERNGWAQLYRYDSNGKLLNKVTKGAFHVHKIINTCDATQTVYFTGMGFHREDHPYYQHFYKIQYDGSNLVELNKGDFFAEVNISDDCKYFLSNHSKQDMAPENYLKDNRGREIIKLETADFSQLYAAGWKDPKIFKVKAADGITDLWGVMYKPFNFDSTKVYPIIEYVYPGPQVEATYYKWGRNVNRLDRLAQLGFVVITIGNRGGHPNRSKWYHNYGYGNMRDYPLEDHKTAIQQLQARYDWISPTKVGIHGHSGGGFMSTAAILTYPDFYKVAVSCSGNHDNRIYNRWWSETHNGIKEVVSDKGDTTFKFSIHYNQELAKNLKGHLLLVTGEADNNVHPANTMRMVNAFIKNNKRFELLVLPEQRHGYGKMDKYFFWKMADFFSEYLIGNCEDTVNIPQMNND